VSLLNIPLQPVKMTKNRQTPQQRAANALNSARMRLMHAERAQSGKASNYIIKHTSELRDAYVKAGGNLPDKNLLSDMTKNPAASKKRPTQKLPIASASNSEVMSQRQMTSDKNSSAAAVSVPNKSTI
jgi:hypothetical protein